MMNCNDEILSLKWNRCDSKLEPPETTVYVFTSMLDIRRGKRLHYSSAYHGNDYVCADTGEKLGRCLFWAYI